MLFHRPYAAPAWGQHQWIMAGGAVRGGQAGGLRSPFKVSGSGEPAESHVTGRSCRLTSVGKLNWQRSVLLQRYVLALLLRHMGNHGPECCRV
jgi:hypothetical protein